ncbi:MAG: ornithine--oxo-acid transaminase [Candidatus Lokiarchaeota archaeon]|nr:ornithine--oxo-acid transaminase [Candidatus Lokiarchaeota archaeon]MBD3199276.1 ornithine--oxo-acid transaminase [Candidatus Lokiarchaeota archaeon]
MPSSEDYIEMDYKYGAHNYHPIPVVISKAQGVWVFDPEGKKYLDCLSAYSSQNTGHCHPEIIEAMKKQADKVTLTSRAFHNDMMGPYLKKLCELVGPHINDPKNVGIMALPMNTGTEAVSTGLKVTRAWGYIKKKIPKNKAHIFVCNNNFHGRTITIAGFSSDISAVRYYGNFGPYTPGFSIIPYGDPEKLKNHIIEIGPENVAGFLFEPIQGEAGVNVPPEGYIKAVREICTKYNVLMIADEIQTGLGRTGALFACDHEQVKPDMLLLGKALGGGIYPVSAVVSVKEVIGPDVIKKGTHGSTFGGNPLACAVATKALDIHIENNLAERANDLGAYFINGLKKIAKKETKIPVKDVRGKGLLTAIEFTQNARSIVEDLMNNGILAKDTHSTTIRFAPPLVITKEELDWALNTIESVLVE